MKSQSKPGRRIKAEPQAIARQTGETAAGALFSFDL
jgi:hypothetical protein